MKTEGTSLVINVNTLDAIPFPIPGATPDGVRATLVNVDGAKGLVTTIIHIAPGARIPAHYHNDGAEAHFVLEGDFINAGVSHGPGGFVTHPAGVVHGPHESKGGCKVLTLQTAYVDPAKPDFNIAE
jgi:quercetin dioxygenase-like cupin family protein